MTVARLKMSENSPPKEKITKWLSKTFHNYRFDIKDIAVLHRAPNNQGNYQTLKHYRLQTS